MNFRRPGQVRAVDRATADSSLLVLLSLNLLLLALFILLNSMALPKNEEHAADVLAEVRLGGAATAAPQSSAMVPGIGQRDWTQSTEKLLRGVIANRFELLTAPQETKATWLEVRIPLAEVLRENAQTGRVMVNQKLVSNLLAAGQQAELRWVLQLPADLPAAPAMLAALSELTDRAELQLDPLAADGFLKLRVSPGRGMLPEVGVKLQQLGAAVGGTTQGLRERPMNGQ